MTVREDLNIKLDGVHGPLTISVEALDDDGAQVWIGIDTSEDEGISVAVDPQSLVDAVGFLLGKRMIASF